MALTPRGYLTYILVFSSVVKQGNAIRVHYMFLKGKIYLFPDSGKPTGRRIEIRQSRRALGPLQPRFGPVGDLAHIVQILPHAA